MKNLAGNCLRRARQIVDLLVARATITMYTGADIKIPQQSVSKSHPSPKTTTTTTSSTRRDATRPIPSQPHPRAPKPSKRQHPSKNEGTNTLMGQYQKNHIRDLTHTSNPYRNKKNPDPESHKAKSHLPQKKTTASAGGQKGRGKLTRRV